MLASPVVCSRRDPWNRGKLVGQKAPLRLRDIWAIRVRLEIGDRKRELALFNLALDSPRYRARRSNRRARDCHATEDPAAGAVRDHGADTQVGPCLDSACGTQDRGLSVPESVAALSPSRHGNTPESSKLG